MWKYKNSKGEKGVKYSEKYKKNEKAQEWR